MPLFVPVLMTLLLGAPPVPPTPWGVLRTFKIGGEGRWDYVNLDPEGGRIYVPRSTRVMVLRLTNARSAIVLI